MAAQTLGRQVRDTDPTTRRRRDPGTADLRSYPVREAKRPSWKWVLEVRTEVGPHQPGGMGLEAGEEGEGFL